MMIKQDAHLIELTGLELAKYLMLRLVDNHESIEQLSQNFDNDVRFINRVVDFLKDIKWVEQDQNGLYQMTDIVRLKVNATRIVA
jgi:predicted transcriptional regulator